MTRDERVTDEMVEVAARILADDLREIGMSPDSPIAAAEGKIVSFWETFKGVARATLSAALEAERPVAVALKPLEWKDIDGGNVTLTALARTPFGSYFIEIEPEGYVLKFGHIGLLPHPTYEAAKAAAQQDYETRIRSAIVGVAGTSIPADLVERCAEIFGWKKTGVLTGDRLRSQARAIRGKFNSVFDAGEALRQAEEETKREAMRFIIAISTTRIADSAETGGSATLSKGSSDDHL